MIVTETFQKSIERIIDEGIRIKNHNKETLLNSKSEFHGPSMKRRVLEGNKEQCDRCNFKASNRDKLTKHIISVHQLTKLRKGKRMKIRNMTTVV